MLLLNGLAVLFFAPIPHVAKTTHPGTLTPSFGVGGWMPIAAGLLCFAGAAWMLNRHRKVTRIADLVHADLPESGHNPESRGRFLRALLDRANDLVSALVLFPEALVTIDLQIGDAHRLEFEVGKSVNFPARLSPVKGAIATKIEQYSECVLLETEALLDFPNEQEASDFVEILASDILDLPPDYELSGDIQVTKRQQMST